MYSAIEIYTVELFVRKYVSNHTRVRVNGLYIYIYINLSTIQRIYLSTYTLTWHDFENRGMRAQHVHQATSPSRARG